MKVSQRAFRAIGRLPVGVASAIGARLGPLVAPRQMPVRAERARRNLAALRPDLDPAERERLLAARWANMGRFMFELPVMAKLNRPGRTIVEDAAAFTAMLETPRPIIAVSLHLGNWELLGAHLALRIDRAGIGVFEPPDDPVQAALLDEVRRTYLTAMIPAGTGGARRIVSALRSTPKALLYILLDERREFQVGFPFFGRPPKPEGNLSIALRLAASTDALIVPMYCLREGATGSRLHWTAPIDVRAAGQEAAIDALEHWFAPVVRAHLDQWLALQDIALA